MNVKKLLLLFLLFTLSICVIGCKKKTSSSLETTTKEETTSKEDTTLKSIISTTMYEDTTTESSSSDTTTEDESTTIKDSDTSISSSDVTSSKDLIITATSNSSYVTSYYSDFDFDEFFNLSSTDSMKDYIYNYIYVVLVGQSYDSPKTYFSKTDKNPETGLVQMFYTHVDRSADSNGKMTFGSSNGTVNREHVWPQSLGDSKNEQGGYDLHHIRPTLYETNNERGNKVFGNVEHSASNKKVCEGVTYAYSTSKVFEPMDEVKGDVARICFYYSIMYGYDLKIIVSDKTLKEILEWNELDPVSEMEIYRNNAVYEIQGNRNIFIDYPDLANYIFGN